LSDDHVLDSIRSFTDRTGYPPTIRELGALIERSTETTLRHLRRLEANGHITRSPGRARGISLPRSQQ
jgi:SOS-response transcriptional repressor LexA